MLSRRLRLPIRRPHLQPRSTILHRPGIEIRPHLHNLELTATARILLLNIEYIKLLHFHRKLIRIIPEYRRARRLEHNRPPALPLPLIIIFLLQVNIPRNLHLMPKRSKMLASHLQQREHLTTLVGRVAVDGEIGVWVQEGGNRVGFCVEGVQGREEGFEEVEAGGCGCWDCGVGAVVDCCFHCFCFVVVVVLKYICVCGCVFILNGKI